MTTINEDLQKVESKQDKLIAEWAPLLEDVKGHYKRRAVAQLIENQVNGAHMQGAVTLSEDVTTTANIKGFDPVLINMTRRNAARLIAHEIMGVQSMTMPTGLAFALRARYTNATGKEALYDHVNVNFGGDASKDSSAYEQGTVNPFLEAGTAPNLTDDQIGGGVDTATAETAATWSEMSATVESLQVKAKTIQLKSSFSPEVRQDWQTVHGMDAGNELSMILGQESLVEINQFAVRTLYAIATPGAARATTPGTYDLRADSDGRWSVERMKGLMYQVNREANEIARSTRRGKGNILIASPDVVSALQMAGVLDFAPALEAMTGALDSDINVGSGFAGIVASSGLRVYIDPFIPAGVDGFVVGYKGATPYDAGVFYCPYQLMVPFEAKDPKNFNTVLGIKSRFGIVANPLTTTDKNKNVYYRKVAVKL